MGPGYEERIEIAVLKIEDEFNQLIRSLEEARDDLIKRVKEEAEEGRKRAEEEEYRVRGELERAKAFIELSLELAQRGAMETLLEGQRVLEEKMKELRGLQSLNEARDAGLSLLLFGFSVFPLLLSSLSLPSCSTCSKKKHN